MTDKYILVVDDEKNLCAVIKACLENIGRWKVKTSLSAKEGLLIAEKEQPDAILLDVMMPDLDGMTAFQQLQNNPKTAKIPVIFLTAKVQIGDLAKFSELGIYGVISKPFDPLKLSAEVAALLKW